MSNIPKAKVYPVYEIGEQCKYFTSHGENVRATVIDVQPAGTLGAVVYKLREDTNGKEHYTTAAYMGKIG